MIKVFKQHRSIILILLLVFILRLPTLFEPNRYADEDIYLTLGQAIRRGLTLYRDIHDNKPPLLYFVAALAHTVAGFRFILLIWHLANVVFLWHLAKKLFNHHFPVVLSTLLFAVFSSIPLTEGNIANGEIFMIMPVTAAMLLVFASKPNFFLIGLLFSLAFLFKIPVAFELFGLALWLMIYQPKPLTKIFPLIISFSLPILGSIFYYYQVGAGQPYVRAALLQNVGYVSSWENSLPLRGLILFFLLGLVFIFRHRLGPKFVFINIWFFTALFGALLSGRPYPHYMIETIAPLSLLFAWLLKSSQIHRFFILLSLIITALSLRHYHYWYYPSLSYYSNFLKYSLRLQTKTDYYRFFGEQVIYNYQIANYIKENTNPSDRIFVWGTEPAIYALSNRLPVGKYTVAYHVADFKGYSLTIDNFKISPPPYVVYFPNNPSFPELDRFLNNYYFPVNQIGPAIIFKLH